MFYERPNQKEFEEVVLEVIEYLRNHVELSEHVASQTREFNLNPGEFNVRYQVEQVRAVNAAVCGELYYGSWTIGLYDEIYDIVHAIHKGKGEEQGYKEAIPLWRKVLIDVVANTRIDLYIRQTVLDALEKFGPFEDDVTEAIENDFYMTIYTSEWHKVMHNVMGNLIDFQDILDLD